VAAIDGVRVTARRPARVFGGPWVRWPLTLGAPGSRRGRRPSSPSTARTAPREASSVTRWPTPAATNLLGPAGAGRGQIGGVVAPAPAPPPGRSRSRRASHGPDDPPRLAQIRRKVPPKAAQIVRGSYASQLEGGVRRRKMISEGVGRPCSAARARRASPVCGNRRMLPMSFLDGFPTVSNPAQGPRARRSTAAGAAEAPSDGRRARRWTAADAATRRSARSRVIADGRLCGTRRIGVALAAGARVHDVADVRTAEAWLLRPKHVTNGSTFVSHPAMTA
jgi:hypothetical protein